MQNLRARAVLLSTALALSASVSLAAADTLVLRGARVLTMDEAKPEATAIAVVDGRIAAVGSPADMEPYLKGATVYDLPAGALVLPGFQDGHNHLVWSATQEEDIDLTDVMDAEALKTAFAGVEALPQGTWVRGGMWDIVGFAAANAKMLDEVTGDRPAYVESADVHSGWVNSAAMKLGGIDAATKDPEGGRIERDAAGNPTGILREKAMEMVSRLLADYPDQQVDNGLAKALDEAESYGITAIIDPSVKEWMLRGYKRFDDAGKLRIRVKAAVNFDREGSAAAGVAKALDLRSRYAGPHLDVNAVKLYPDSAIESETAALLEAYVGKNSAGDLLIEPDAMAEIVTAADAAGLHLHVHAIGDRAVRVSLDAYEAARKANGPRDARPQIAHVELVDPADIPRFAALGVLANIQATWAYPDSYIVDETEPKLGPKRSEWLYPFGALKNAGTTLVGGSDWNVSSMNPLEAIQTGVTRQDIADPNGRVLTPQHRLEVMDMLRAYTVNSAYAAFDEANSGTLTVGKRGDIVVLDRDITKVPATDIAAGQFLATVIDGAVVHEGEGLPAPTSP